MFRRWILGFSFVVASTCTNVARADVPMSEAEREFQQGLAYYDAEKFAEALERFRASLALERRPKVWANIIYCLVNMERDIEAITEYDAFVAAEGRAMPTALQGKLEPYVLSIGRALGFGLLTIETSVPGVVLLDGKRLGDLGPGIPRRVPAGKHVVRLEAQNMAPAEQTVDVHGGERSRIKLKVRRPLHLEMRLSMFGGFAIPYEKLDDDCSVYCFPGLAVLVGARLTIPLKGAFVAEIGGDYLHMRSSMDADWPAGAPGVTQRAQSLFTVHAVLAQASAGMDVLRGPLRFQWRLGGGFVRGQHVESGSTDSNTPQSPGATQLAPLYLGVLRGRIGLSWNVHRVWLGAGLEGLVSLNRGPETNAPWVNGVTLVGPNNEEVRPLGRLVVLSPELSVGGSL